MIALVLICDGCRAPFVHHGRRLLEGPARRRATAAGWTLGAELDLCAACTLAAHHSESAATVGGFMEGK